MPPPPTGGDRSGPSTAEAWEMMAVRRVFVGTPAFLGRIDGRTRCAFWSEEPVDHDFDPGLLIEIDLALSPSAAAAKEISWEQDERAGVRVHERRLPA